MEETDSFVMTTFTQNSEKIIDTAKTGFVIQMQLPAEIAVDEFTIGPREVGQYSAATVTLNLPTVYEAAGYLTMTLPETVQIDQ